jgi:hypothetical protein
LVCDVPVVPDMVLHQAGGRRCQVAGQWLAWLYAECDTFSLTPEAWCDSAEAAESTTPAELAAKAREAAEAAKEKA